MKSKPLSGFSLMAVAFASILSAVAQSLPSLQEPAAIPLDQLGAVAGKQYQGDGLSITSARDGARLRCAFQRLEGHVTREGLWLSSIVDGSPNECFRVIAVEVRRDIACAPFANWLQPAGMFSGLSSTGDVSTADNVVRFIRSGLTEEYSVSVDGVRQDFIVEQRPAGDGELRVELNVTGATAESIADGARLVLNSGRKLAYHRLRVTDDQGRELAARLEVSQETSLAVVVDDASAIYPVRIDPTFSDADWQNWSGLPGADGTVSAVVFDGSGNLFIGGSCNVVGNIVAKQIAKWDGSSWSSLGGINGTVSAMVVSGTNLYVGGSFNMVGLDMAGGIVASNIAKWNGSSWSPLGSGLNVSVSALAISGSDLYVGGSFSFAGDVFALRVAKWDGSAWSALGSGLNNTVNALAVIGSDLYAGGTFTQSGSTSLFRIAKWNGSTWSAVGSGSSGAVNALAVSGTDLYAAGTFTIPANNIAKWNGTAWSALGSGLGNTANSLAVSGGNVYVGGSFTTANGNPASRIAKWDGSSWSALGSGMNNTVAALAVSGDTVAAGGSFTTPAMRIATWNGTTWTNLGSGVDGQVNAVAVSGSDVYVGGGFVFRDVPSGVNIVRWNGSGWSAVGAGLNGSVHALTTFGDNLYAGGGFTVATNAGGETVTVNRIARWNGTAWSAMDVGMDKAVNALVFSGNDLYAGGGFSTAGGNAVYNIAKWNGTAWSALGGGLSTSVNGAVKALAALDGNIYAAGDFTSATNSGGVSIEAARIAKWDGSMWSPLSSGMNTTVNALAVDGSILYAGGFFNTAGGVPVGRIAKWNGTTWSVLGSATNNIFVYSLAVSGSDLYVGGGFSIVGGNVPANNIAKWDGTNWTALGSGISGTSFPSAFALAVASGELYVGGSFTKAGGNVAGSIAKATIGAIAAPGRFNALSYSSITGFSFTFVDASIGQPYRIQTSPSLMADTWTDFTNFSYNGPIVITDSLGSDTNKFFRAVTP